MKERLVCLCLALVPALCPALQITSYNVWADGRTLVTTTPREDLAGPRNEWTLVIFIPEKLDLESLTAERNTMADPGVSEPFNAVTTASLSPVGRLTSADDTAGLAAQASTEHPIHMGRKEIIPAADPVGVPDRGSTAELATIAFSGLVLLHRLTSGRSMRQ